jgi:hypothetical protein
VVQREFVPDKRRGGLPKAFNNTFKRKCFLDIRDPERLKRVNGSSVFLRLFILRLV